MRAASPHLYRRGKRGTFYLRRRIPTEVLDAYRGGVREIVRSLRTRDPFIAERTLRSALVDLDREFALKATRLREERRLPRQQRVSSLKSNPTRRSASSLRSRRSATSWGIWEMA